MNEPFNAADTRSLRRAAKAAKQAQADRQGVVFNLMSSPTGRTFVHDWLVQCHIFETTFTLNALGSAFNEGKRSIGLQLLGDVVQFAPDQYIQMMREAADKEQINGRSNNDSGHSGGDSPAGRDDNGRADDAGGSVASEWDPFLDDDA